MSNVTIETLLERKQRQAVKQFSEVDVKVGGDVLTFTIERLPLNRVLRLMGDDLSGLSIAEQFDRFVQIIYAACPIFRNKELQAAYEVAEPSDIVAAVLCDNADAINVLGSAVLAQYGLDDGKAVDDVKN